MIQRSKNVYKVQQKIVLYIKIYMMNVRYVQRDFFWIEINNVNNIH